MQCCITPLKYKYIALKYKLKMKSIPKSLFEFIYLVLGNQQHTALNSMNVYWLTTSHFTKTSQITYFNQRESQIVYTAAYNGL